MAATFRVGAQDIPDLVALWETIKQSISDGTFSEDAWKLDGLGGFSGKIEDFDWSQLPGGMEKIKNLDLGEGGLLSDMFGGLFGDQLMSALGIEELHNDASLDSNILWGIAMVMKAYPGIKENQKKIMSQQDSINMSIKRLYELELLTLKYY